MGEIPVYVVITAAGSGERLGMRLPKALVPVAGKPLLVHALERMAQVPAVRAIIVTAPASEVANFAELTTATLASTGVPGVVLPGGASRQESVARGLEHVRDHFLQREEASIPEAAAPDCATSNEFGDAIILVHDAARAFTPPAVAQRVIAAVAAGCPAVVPGLPAVDTMRLVRAGGAKTPAPELAPTEASETAAGDTTGDAVSTAIMPEMPLSSSVAAAMAGGEIELVESELERAQVRIVQTPQGFPADVLLRAHGLQLPQVPADARARGLGVDTGPAAVPADARARGLGQSESDPETLPTAAQMPPATDDAALVARLKLPVVIVPGDPLALKVTYPQDIAVVEQLVNAHVASS